MGIFRIVRQKFAHDLSGEGAKRYGGRWNSIGNPCIYTSTNISLCLCEYLVNLPSYLMPDDLQLVTYTIDLKHIKKIDMSELPKNWNAIPVSTASQFYGDSLLEQTSITGFSIPSVIIPQERNIIINPLCEDFSKLVTIQSVEDFNLDQRFEK